MPGYDHIIRVQPTDSRGPLPILAQVVVPERHDNQPLQPGETVAVLLLQDGSADTPIRVTAAKLHVETEIYLEEGELSFSELGDEPS